MILALNAVSEGTSVNQAAIQFTVPRSSLRYRIDHPNAKDKNGPQTKLTELEEKRLFGWIDESAKRGGAQSSRDVLEDANKMLKSRDPASSELSRGWLQKFNKRVQLSYRVPDKIGRASANVSEKNIRNWFQTINNYANENPEVSEALSDSRRVLNADETFVNLDSTASRVLAPKGMKHVYKTSKDHKTGITVMASYSGSGVAFKPFVVYPGERLSQNINTLFPHEKAKIVLTKKGWMDSSKFCDFLKFLSQQIQEKGIKLPVVLFLDNHASHCGLEAAELAENLKIKLIFLYPNSTFLLQPCDVAIFKCLKSLWREESRKTRKETEIKKENFGKVFVEAHEKIPVHNIISGFAKSGIFPFNADAVDYSRCLGKDPTGKNQHFLKYISQTNYYFRSASTAIT